MPACIEPIYFTIPDAIQSNIEPSVPLKQTDMPTLPEPVDPPFPQPAAPPEPQPIDPPFPQPATPPEPQPIDPPFPQPAPSPKLVAVVV